MKGTSTMKCVWRSEEPKTEPPSPNFAGAEARRGHSVCVLVALGVCECGGLAGGFQHPRSEIRIQIFVFKLPDDGRRVGTMRAWARVTLAASGRPSLQGLTQGLAHSTAWVGGTSSC